MATIGAAPVQRVWTDRALRRRLRDDPRAGLAELGIEIPAGVRVKAIACKGSPGDVDDPSLFEFLLERGQRSAFFFLPSPRSPCSQQAAYGIILGRELADPQFTRRFGEDAAAAIAQLVEGR